MKRQSKAKGDKIFYARKGLKPRHEHAEDRQLDFSIAEIFSCSKV